MAKHRHIHSTNPDTIAALKRLDRQFMTPEIEFGDCWEVSANHGETHYVPADVCADAGGLADYWTTGTFYRVSQIPAACAYQRELAAEAGLPA